MPLALADRVQQSGTANTTISFTLSGSVTGFQSFAVIGDGNTTYYAATDASETGKQALALMQRQGLHLREQPFCLLATLEAQSRLVALLTYL